MGKEYLSDLESFATHEDVSARESVAGASLLLAGLMTALVTGLVLGLAAWRRRRSA